MSQGINSGDNHISVSHFLRVYLHCWHFLLPQVPLSIFDSHFEIDQNVWNSGLTLNLTQHRRQLNVMSGHDICDGL